MQRYIPPTLAIPLLALALLASAPLVSAAPRMTTSQLGVRPWVQGLELPTTFAFIGDDDLLVLEKASGRVMRVTNGEITGPVLDLAVNSASERGLLGIALHPNFPDNPGVYLFWSCKAPPPTDPFFPSIPICVDPPELGTGDSNATLEAPLIGNRVDRFEWNGSTLTWNHNLIVLRSFQNDAAPTPPGQGDEEQPPRANHDGGILRFGHDGKLYVMFGDVGRRGQLQNLPSGPTLTGLGPTVPDDQFGGPQPDDAHFSGVILRLNDDGTIPTDNPFHAAGAAIGGEIGENIQRTFMYGIRNSFGMDVDPLSGNLWQQENGEDAYDEINLVRPGSNGGWIQVAGPIERVPDFRLIETTSLHNETFPNLQQLRWGPERIATTPEEARSRLFVIPGSHYDDPEFSWRWVLAPAAIGFVDGDGLGPSFNGDLLVGFSTPQPLGGPLFRFQLAGNRRALALDGALADRVADNSEPYGMTESEELVIGENFGIVTDIRTGPNGNVYVASLLDGAIYEIFRTAGARGRGRPHVETEPAVTTSSLSVERLAGASAHTIHFAIDRPANVRITVHNVSGRIVAELMNETASAGAQSRTWSAQGIVPGVYFVRLEQRAAGATSVRSAKVVVVD